MIYALWDTRATNMIAEYDNERDALALVLSGIERNGPSDSDTLILEVENEAGNLIFTISGDALAAMAKERPHPSRVAD
ncbi:MAG: hypothetical protein IT334_08905 [Thermomicrobiales bacterium]|nr:hypothetical protein [Thermomicrobiales bacterium]